MYTTASVFFKTLADAGITHAFVNWGSDHPAFLEDLQRQRIENGGRTLVEIVTCPSEYVALSAAHGYALVTGKPAALIIHVDVGTQSLAGAIHNADRGQVPVLIFAGCAPFTANGELHGSKNEFILWLQDVPDQSAIVRQYMRYTAQIQSGKHVSKDIMRALQIATSQPKGPVYLWARREVVNEEVDEETMKAPPLVNKWPSITMPAPSSQVVETITTALVQAEFPLIIAANSGRNSATISSLTYLSRMLGIGLLATAACVVSIPFNHPHFLGYTFVGKVSHLENADVILLLDCDVPWADVTNSEPRADARIFVIDNDPLKRTFGWSHVDAELLCTADTEVALAQLLNALRVDDLLSSPSITARLEARTTRIASLRSAWLAELATAETMLAPDSTLPPVPHVLGTLRDAVRSQTPSHGTKVLWLNEAASHAGLIWNHIQPEEPGSMFMSGGTSLGWFLGGSIGASLGARVAGKAYDVIVAITGDGNFLFGAPTAAYWVARRYGAPFVTVVLNNRGWQSPKLSMRAVHPDGHGSQASGEKLSVGFGMDHNVDFGGIAAAAGGAWARRVERGDELRSAFEEAVRVVMHEKRCAVVECVIESV